MNEKYIFIEQARCMNQHAIAKWAESIGLSKSGYYTWLKERNKRAKRQERRSLEVIQMFEEGQGHYGAEHICGVIRSRGGKASFDCVKAIMKENGLKSSHCRRRRRSLTNSRAARKDSYNNLTQDLIIDAPFQVLSSDITYIRTGEGFEYLCQIRDVFSNVVLGVSQSSRMTQDLVHQALCAVQGRFNLPRDIIFHSDRGSQYTAEQTQKLIASFGWHQSYSRVGKPGDNAWSESFFTNMKKEIIHWNNFPTRDDARQACFEYIENYYNYERVQKNLGFLAPAEYLRTWQEEHNLFVA